MKKIKCPICGCEIEDEPYTDCYYCGWGYTGDESAFDENEEDPFNKMTREQAKENLSKGLNIWGEPLPVKTQD